MITAVAAEYNPFHNGHKLHLDLLREKGASTIAVVMSGNFVQRGEPAVCMKTPRAVTALQNGADLVVELPVTRCVASAQRFAEGNIAIMTALGAEAIGFGAETDDTEALVAAARHMLTPHFKESLRFWLSTGISYAAAVCKATEPYSELLRSPNNLLGVEYIKAALSANANLRFIAVKRQHVEHDSPVAVNSPDAGYASASQIRRLIQSGEDYSRFVPPQMAEYLKSGSSDGSLPADVKILERALLVKLSTLSPLQISEFPDVTEGLENKIHTAAAQCGDLDSLIASVKSKRFTHARLRRIFLNILLDIKKADTALPLSYIRPLAFNENGQRLLKRSAELPVYVKSSLLQKDSRCAPLFEIERRASRIYSLCLPSPAPCDELKFSPVKL